MLTDYHTHSWRCGHASGTMREYVLSAIEQGIGEIGLTDHLWMYWLAPSDRPREWAIPESMFEEHYAEMIAVRNEFSDRINVRVAVEADYVEGHEEALRSILARYDFDFVLGSVHFMDGWMIDVPENAEKYRQQRVADIYRRYFAMLSKAVRLGAFDVLAHFDLPKKFGFLPEEDLTATVTELLDQIADAGISIEVSTAGLRKPIGEIYPSRSILLEMAARRIPIVLSSDAHSPDEVGADYAISVPLVRELGWRSLTTFSERRAVAASLG